MIDHYIEENDLFALVKQAKNNCKKRHRICLHKSHNSKIQEMIIAVTKESVIEFHRQPKRAKTYVLLEGELIVHFLGENNNKTDSYLLSQKKRILCFQADNCHTVQANSDVAIFLEFIEGPYDSNDTQWFTCRNDS